MIEWIFVVFSAILSLCIMPVTIHFCNKKNIFDYQDSRKIHSGNISRLGGIGIATSFFICVILYLFITKQLFQIKYLSLIISSLIIFWTSLIDDFKPLPAKVKLIMQIIATLIVVLNGYTFTQIYGLVFSKPFAIIFTFLWILGVINALNLIDGLDGSCGSISITTLISFGLLYTFSGNMEATICFILAASVFGFLCFNWPPAKIFMGDSGSTFLGFMIATIPLYTTQDNFEYNKFFMACIMLLIPILDVIAAVWRRLRDKKPIMCPYKSHLHHKLLNIGFTKKQSLFLIIVIQVMLCFASIISYFLRWRKGTILLVIAFFFMTLFFSTIHFINRKVNLLKKHGEE